MKSLQTLINQFPPLQFKRNLFLLLFFGFFFFSPTLIFAQEDLTKEQTEQVFKSIAKYTSGISDKTTQFLKKQGYNPPAYLKKEFNQYPAIRKIEMAYEAAENKKKGKGGKRFLAMLSKDLAQRYEGANHEEALKGPINEKVKSKKIKFKHPKSYGKISLPKQVKSQIFSISKYTERGALGGTRGVLKHKFGLLDNEVYDILRSSKSSNEALERGLSKSKTPPSHRDRIRNVSRELQKNYEGARYDKNLNKAAQTNEKRNSKNNKNQTARKKKISESFSKDSKKSLNKSNTPKAKTKYNKFVQKNYNTPSARKFSSMRIKSKGFGGIIFGSPIIDNTNLPNIKHIKFIPNDRKNADSLEVGVLEFIFEDGTELIESSVILEDIIAANEIIFGKYVDFTEGDGIGLAGIYDKIFYLDDMIRWEAIIHPSIQNQELAWSCLLSDVLPIAREDVLLNLKNNISYKDSILLNEWFKGLPGTWKITDVPLEITHKDGRLFYNRMDINLNEIVQDAFLKMEGFYNIWDEDEEVEEDDEFYNLVPVLTYNIEEYNRLNEFAKVLSLFRWAKSKGGSLITKYNNKNSIPSPEVIFITSNQQVEYFTPAEENRKFEKRMETELNDLKSIADTNYWLVDSLHTVFIGKWEAYKITMDENWKIITKSNDFEDLCNLETKNEIEEFRYTLWDINDYSTEYDNWKRGINSLLKTARVQRQVFEAFKERYCGGYELDLVINIPSTNEDLDISIPSNAKLSDLLTEFSNSEIIEVDSGNWNFKNYRGQTLDLNKTIEELNLKSGEELILIIN